MGNSCFSGFVTERKSGGKIEMGYWAIRGLGAPLRMMLEYNGANYTDFRVVEPGQWFGAKKEEVKAKNPLANLPYLIDGDTTVCQTNACFLYLGDRFGMNGKTPTERLKTTQLIDEIYDLRNTVIDLVYPFKTVCRDQPEHEKKLREHLQKGVKASYGKLNAVVAGPFCLGSAMSTADFHLFEMLDQHELMYAKMGVPSSLGEFPALKGLHASVKALPQLKKYFASDAYTLPCNNPVANCYFK
jgi:glutathione S-transferase